jgi:hypothetical protein
MIYAALAHLSRCEYVKTAGLPLLETMIRKYLTTRTPSCHQAVAMCRYRTNVLYADQSWAFAADPGSPKTDILGYFQPFLRGLRGTTPIGAGRGPIPGPGFAGRSSEKCCGLRPRFGPGTLGRTWGTRPVPTVGFCLDTVPKGRLRVAQDAVLGEHVNETSPVGTTENAPGRQSWVMLDCARMLK